MKKIATLQVQRTTAGSRLVCWDAEKATRSEYVKHYLSLSGFLEGDVDHAVAAGCIRPYVEQRLRHLYPGPPAETRDTLGDMIRRIRESKAGDRLHDLQTKLPELEVINGASLPAAHATDDVAGMPPLTADEVRILPGRRSTYCPSRIGAAHFGTGGQNSTTKESSTAARARSCRSLQRTWLAFSGCGN